MSYKHVASYWFRRFQVISQGEHYHFRDWLQFGWNSVHESKFEKITECCQLDLAYFQYGFLPGAFTSVFGAVKLNSNDIKSDLFWQFPCRTESVAWCKHYALASPVLNQYGLNIYIGLPWATWIDKEGQGAWSGFGKEQMNQQLKLLKVRLSGIKYVLRERGVSLRVHTVCQHIHWKNLLTVWQTLGITDLWLSHCPVGDSSVNNIQLHPWHLFAVNVEDTERSVGIQVAKDPADKKTLASFVGAHMSHYLNDIRLRLRQFENEDDFVIRVKEKWHFDDVVYQHQMGGKSLQESYQIDDSVVEYNLLLSDSVFSLCPVGAGPNTLRLWESLAVGSIPVLFGDNVRLPEGGSLGSIDWDSVVIRIEDEQLPQLPQILRAMPLEERRRRQQACLEAYAKVKAQRCF